MAQIKISVISSNIVQDIYKLTNIIEKSNLLLRDNYNFDEILEIITPAFDQYENENNINYIGILESSFARAITNLGSEYKNGHMLHNKILENFFRHPNIVIK
jgi:hypothetical protein